MQNLHRHFLALIAKCEGDLKPVFLLQHNVTNGAQIRVVPASNFLECSEICARSNVNKGKII